MSWEPRHTKSSLTGWLSRLAVGHASRARRANSRIGPLVLATILLVVGMGVFVPELPVGMIFGVFAIVLGCLIAYSWVTRGGRR